MEQKDNNHKSWAGDKKPSMKRRSEQNNYTERGIYLITIAIEGRQPLLGTLLGSADTTEGPDKPHVVLSPLGEKVKACWHDISTYYPQIETMKLCIMPDHLHGILFVHDRIERHLGHVINGFKAGTRKAARQLGLLAEAQPQPTEHTTASAAATASKAPTASAAATSATASKDSKAPQGAKRPSPVPYAEAQPQPASPKHPAKGTLWEPGYNDRLLLKKGQLQHMLAYLDDNPRRLLLKRHHAQYFTHLGTITVADIEMQAMGNPGLLKAERKLQVQCSRHLYPWEIEERKQQFLLAGQQGAIIVSPCISPGEREIATACMEAGVPLIVLLLKGFPAYFKPQPRYLEACAAGRLLMLSPFPWQNEKITNMRQRCLYLNDVAFRIATGVNTKGNT